MRIVKISDLSEEEKKKAKEEIEKRKTDYKEELERRNTRLQREKTSYVSNAKISEESIKNIQEGNLKKADKFVPSIQYKSSPVLESINDFHEENTAPVVKNLFLGLGKGLMYSAESGVSAIDRTYQDRDKMMDIMTANTNKIRAEKGYEPLPTAEESRKIILGDSYNKDLFGRDKEEQQKKWDGKKKEIDTKIASNIEHSDTVIGKKLTELAPSLGQQIPGIVLPGPVGLTYFVGSATEAYRDEAKERGITGTKADVYSGLMGAFEGLTDAIGGSLTKSVYKNFLL